jgi:hypothetical protein
LPRRVDAGRGVNSSRTAGTDEVAKAIAEEPPTERMSAEAGSLPEESAGYLDARILVPGIGGPGMVAAAGLLWAGAHGAVAGYLVLFYGGILAVAAGVGVALALGVVGLGVISLVGLLWFTLERVALAVGPGFGWAAPVLLVAGLIVLPGPVRAARATAEARRRFRELKGGSVPP